MRIDEIDLYGTWKINGLAGSSGQVISYDGSSFGWTQASSTPALNAIRKSGYNHVIVETVNTGNAGTDAITNGDNLLAGYEAAKLLDVGVLGPNKRVTVLLMPGDYDISTSPLELNTSYIDIVGMSTFAGHTILRSSTNSYTITYLQDVDSRLENIDLRVGTIGGVNDNGDSGQYLRWKNVIVNGDCFYHPSVHHFDSINGEFEDIVVKESATFVSAQNNIDGIYKNINYLGNVNAVNLISQSGSISGTYSNIKFTTLGAGIFTAVTDLNVYIDGLIVVSGAAQLIFYGGQNVYGTYKNIFIDGGFAVITANQDIICTIENFTIISGTGDFCSGVGIVNSTSKNLYIDNPSNKGFCSTNSILSGTFSNITFNGFSDLFVSGATTSGYFENIQAGSGGNFFNSNGGNLTGTFKDIEVQSLNNNTFFTNGGDIDGYFENIEIKNSTLSNAFSTEQSSGKIVGTFKNINLLSVTGNIFQSYGDLDGTFENIEITDNGTLPGLVFVCYGDGSILGKFKNISVSKANYLFNAFTGGGINGDFENISFGDIYYAGAPGGTSKIFVSTTSNLLGKYKNISTRNPLGTIFEAGDYINIQVENISLNGVDKCFVAVNNLLGTYKNIRVGDILNPTDDSFKGNPVDIIVDDFVIGNGNSSYDLFFSGDLLTGTFSNIEIGSGFDNVFVNTSAFFSGTFKNIRIGDCASYIFNGGGFGGLNSYIDNLISVDRFYAPFGGTIRNSKIGDGSSGWAFDISTADTVIENCEVNGLDAGPPDYGIYSSIGPINVYISYTYLTGYGIDVGSPPFVPATITNLLNPSYNIDPNQTWPT